MKKPYKQWLKEAVFEYAGELDKGTDNPEKYISKFPLNRQSIVRQALREVRFVTNIARNANALAHYYWD